VQRPAVEIGNYFEGQPANRAAQTGADRGRVSDLLRRHRNDPDICGDADNLGVDPFLAKEPPRVSDLRRDKAQ
jgi:hypothetical protein